MPKRKEVVTKEVFENEDPPVSNVDPADYVIAEEPEPADERELKSFFGGVGMEAARIKAYKFDATGRRHFVAETDVEGMTETFLQERTGEGKYILVAFDAKGQYRGSKTIYIAPGPPKEDKPVILPPAPAVDPTMQATIENLKNESATTRDILLRLIDKIGNNGSGSSLHEMAEAMALLKSVTVQPPAKSFMEQVTEALPVIKSIGEMFMGRTEEKPGWLSTVREIVPQVLETMQTMSRSGIPQETPAPPAPRVEPAVPQLAVAPPAPVDNKLAAELAKANPQTIAKIRGVITFLKTRADARQDPADWVKWTINLMTDDTVKYAVQLVDYPYEEIAAAIDPDLLTVVYRPWFEAYFGGLEDALFEREPSAGERRDGDDAAPDAGSHHSVGANNPDAPAGA